MQGSQIEEGSAPAGTSKGHVGSRAFIGTFGTNVFISICTVIQGIITARLLGPVGKGEFAAIILWPSFFAAIGVFGINIALSRYAAKGEDLPSLTRAGILLSLCTAGITIGACYLLMPHLMPHQHAALIHAANCYLFFILLNHVVQFINAIDQGAGNYASYNITRIVVNPAYLLFLVVLWILGVRNVFWFAMGLLFANGVVAIVRVGIDVSRMRLVGPVFPLLKILKMGSAYGIADLVNPLYQYADSALLLWFLGMRDLGIYTVALSASGVVGALANSLGTITFTMSAQAKTREGFERVVKLFRTSFWIWLGAGGLLALTLPLLIPLVFSRAFAPAVRPAILLIPAFALQGQAMILEQSLRGQGRAFVGLEGRFGGLLVLALMGYFASKQWGILGIVLAYNAAQLTSLCVLTTGFLAHYRIGRLSVLVPTISDLKAAFCLTLNHAKSLGSTRSN